VRSPRSWVRSRPLRLFITAGALSLALLTQACGSATANSPVHARFFGMHVPDFSTTYPSAIAGTVGAVNLTTDGVYWPDLETSAGVWSWDKLDALVDQAHASGAQPMLVLGSTPSFHSTNTRAAVIGASVPDLAAWREYVRQVVTRYGTRLDYEVWPEPNISGNWRGTPAQLASLVASASNIIHAVAPKALVVSPAMVLRMKYQRQFMDRFFATKIGGKRIGRYIDAVGIDPYPVTTGSPEDSMLLVRKARAILRAHDVTAPLWSVEINYGVVGDGQTVTTRPSGTKQASYLVRTLVLSAAGNLKRVYWLGWGTYPTLGIATATADGTPTRAGHAFLTVASWLDGRTVRPCSVDSKRHLYTCRLTQSRTSSWVYWTTRGKAVIRVPKGSRHWTTMDGASKATKAGNRLTVTSAPIWVHP